MTRLGYSLVFAGMLLPAAAAAVGCSGGAPDADSPSATDAGPDDSVDHDADAVEASAECLNGCLIDSVCYPAGPSPLNPCLRCDPEKSEVAWSDADGASCDDGLYCTVQDKCVGGVCAGTPRDCSDGVACNGVETCDEASTMCKPGKATCGDGKLCDVEKDECVLTCSGCVILGVCFGDGQKNPANDCMICHRDLRPWGWLELDDGTVCDDGLYCTSNDVCSGGKCHSGPQLYCSDGVACDGEETCDETARACVPGTKTCTGNTVCDASEDRCVCPGCVIDGECILQGDPCDDGEYCTVGDVCSNSLCRGVPRDCSDGVACNGAETCDESIGACVAGSSTCPSDELCDIAGDACVQACPAQGGPVCGAAGDVVWSDTCGHEFVLEQCVPASAHGACQDASCGCAQGFDGDDCSCTFYVDGTAGSDANSGKSWGQAFATVQAGLDAADADNCDVWVKAGKYVPTVALEPSDPRTKVIQLRPGVALYGGFSGGETSLSQRDVAAHTTVLSGDFDTNGVATDNTYNIVLGANGSRIDGFTITASSGTAMLNTLASPVIANCTFSGNLESAIFNTSGAPLITHCTFSANSAQYYGGAIDNGWKSSPTIVGCLFENNVAKYGGAIANNDSLLTISDCVFDGNTAKAGGAIYNAFNGTLSVSRCEFSNNSSQNGGAIDMSGFGSVVTDCTFIDNDSSIGGALFIESTDLVVTNCVFAGNTASGSGGAIENNGYASPVLANCTFYGNSAVVRGGALESRDHNTDSRLINCTLANNRDGTGAAIWTRSGASTTLTNSIVWGSPVAFMNDSTSSATVSFSIIEGGYPGLGNSADDPQFIELAGGNLHLQPGSPAIDTGSNAALPDGVQVDLDGNPRVVDGDSDGSPTVDMGAFEVQ